MPIDASIYQALKPVDLDPIGAQMKGLQVGQAMYDAQAQQAMRQAFQQNTDENGQLNRQGALSAMARFDPMKAAQLGQHLAAMDKSQAEGQTAQVEAAQKQLSQVMPVLGYVKQMPEDQRAEAWPKLMAQLRSQGVDTSRMGDVYDPHLFQTAYSRGLMAKDWLDAQKSQAETAEKYASTAKLRSETPRQIDLSSISPGTDPATLVPHAVPLSKQKDVYEEIKKAQDIKGLAPKIEEAFDMASSRNPVTARNGRKIFESLINTTVTDLTGTARQAEFDNIHNNMTPSGLLAAPGENEAKKKALLAYLMAKSSAPAAKGSGIDLSKFDSTAPYQGAPAKTAGKGESGTAYAAPAAPLPKHGEVHDGYVFMGGNPADPKSWKRAK